MVEYNCAKCNAKFDQKSHYDRHIKRKVSCVLDNMSLEQVVEKTVNQLAKDKQIKVDKKDIKAISDKVIDNKLEPKKPTKEIVWKREEDNRIESQNISQAGEQLKSKFDSVIKSCQQILYNSGAIVGKKAMDDIMKILTFKLLMPLFKNQDIKSKLEEIKSKIEDEDELEDFDNKKNYCYDMELLSQETDAINRWFNLVQDILQQLFPNIFDEKDQTLNCKENAFKELVKKINSLKDLSKADIKQYDSISGYIYESFMNKYISGGGKDLGQFFTPRKLINLMFYGIDIQKHIKLDNDSTVFDPCAGSGGFLTRIYNCFKIINPKNIYGCEVEKDTIKHCISNLLLTTGEFCENIECKDSILYNDGIKHDLILTNPPFGTSMNYKEYKKTYQENQVGQSTPDSGDKFGDIYPIETNDGACLFTQKCVYKLKENGLCAIVLPDGQLFFGKNFKKFRTWLVEKVNFRRIVQIPSGTFDHTGIKTCIIMFTKNGPTKNIQFLKTNTDCNSLEEIFNIKMKDLKLTEYSFDPKDYMEDEYLSSMMSESNVKWVELGELCKIKSGIRVSFKHKIVDYSNIKYISVENMNPNKNKEDTIYIDDKFALECKAPLLEKNNIIISEVSGNIYTKIVPDIWNKSLFSRGIHHLYDFENNINKFYLMLLFKIEFMTSIMKKYSKGITIGHVNLDDFRKLRIPLPSIEIQESIVSEIAKLEEQTNTLNTVLKQTKVEIEMYRKYGLQKEIRELIKECELCKLGDICEFDNKSKRSAAYGKDEGKFNFYTSSEKIQKCDTADYTEERLLIGDGGKANINIDNIFSCSSHIHIIYSNNKNITNQYIFYHIKMNIVNGIIKMKGNGIQNISKTLVEDIIIPLPSLEVQKQLIEVYQQKENKLNEYKKELEHIKQRLQDVKDLGRNVIEANITSDINTGKNDDIISESSDELNSLSSNDNVKQPIKNKLKN